MVALSLSLALSLSILIPRIRDGKWRAQLEGE